MAADTPMEIFALGYHRRMNVRGLILVIAAATACSTRSAGGTGGNGGGAVASAATAQPAPAPAAGEPAPGQSPFGGLRKMLFESDLATLAPADPGEPPAAKSGGRAVPAVVGVAMEMGLEHGTCLVYGLRDGTASLYLSTGGGWLGGQGIPRVNAAAKDLVRVARDFAGRLERANDHPLPARGRVRFSIFTTDGVRAAEAAESDLMRRRGDLLPLFAAAQEIITGFRLNDEGKQ